MKIATNGLDGGRGLEAVVDVVGRVLVRAL
jgi:hypothetical protein